MARLFGYVGNRADLGGKILELEREALKVLAKGTTLGWGIGFYQAGEVLLRRRPIDERTEIDVQRWRAICAQTSSSDTCARRPSAT